MPRTDVPQRKLRGLTPHDITQHYASERVTAFQMEGHQLTTCLPIRRILEGHVVGPEGLPLLGSLDGSQLILQQLQFLASCATVDMKMRTSVISMEMQISDINSWRRLWENVARSIDPRRNFHRQSCDALPRVVEKKTFLSTRRRSNDLPLHALPCAGGVTTFLSMCNLFRDGKQTPLRCRTSPDLSIPGEIFIIRAVTLFHAPSERRPFFPRAGGVTTFLFTPFHAPAERPSTTQYTPQYEKSTFCLAQRNRNRRQEDRSGRGFNERFNSFTPLNAPVDHIFMQIRTDPVLKWPGKLLTDPDKRPRDKYCRFHRDHGHNTEDCYDLKRQIEELIKQGNLPRFIEKGQREGRPQGARQQRPLGEAPPRPPLGEIHVITRGMAAGGTSRSSRKAYARQIHNVLVTQKSNKKPRVEDLPITFTEEDACKVFHPHDDAHQYPPTWSDFPSDHCSHDDMPSISTNVITHKLNVNPSTTPVKQKRRVFAPERNAAVVEEVDKLLKAGFIREVYYPEWLANVVMVKKSTGKWRICVDFTDLNKACPKDSYPLPRIDQRVDSTAGHKLLSFMDAFSGYNQIQMTEEDQEKTAFITSRGLFCYKAMPFGLKNTGATYQKLVNKMFHDQIGRNVEVYVDDMLVKSKKDENHLADLKETFQALRRYNMKLNPAKCVFGVSSGKFLGFMVLQHGIEANPDKIKAILEMSPPKTVKEVQSLTGKAAALNSSALIREEERIQKPVYYTSRALRRAEERYSNMEKLAFALLISSRKLRPYFQSHPIIVLTDYPLRKAMNKLDAAGRLIQWSIEMSEFHIDYRPRTAIKAQALADFIAEFTQPWKDEGEPEEGEAWTVNIDGSSTKEMSGAGVVLISLEKDKFEYTNNEAEASQRKVELFQIPREENEAADCLARLASSGVEIDGFIEIQGRPSTEEAIVNSITINTTWMLPIIRYLKEGTLLADKTEAHKLRIRASRFQLLRGILYKMGFSRPHLRCLSPEEANYVIREVHEGVCGNHSGARSLAHKLTRAGYYWSFLLHDATQYVKACDKCQLFANVPRVPPEEITPITLPWPFAQWGPDIMGPFPVGTKQAKFLVVAIDYFTKWVEVEPSATISEKNVKGFVWKAVICRFGIPRVLISDNGKHPQPNGQVEITNRTLLKQIKTRLEGAKSKWVEELPSVLWAYRTTVRIPTKETPFKLTSGTEAIILVEIGLTTLRTTFHKEEENEGQLCLNLDLLDETREKAAQRIALYQGKMARYYNTKVKLRRFEVGDWVRRKVTQATKDSSQGKLGPNWEGPYKIIQYYRRDRQEDCSSTHQSEVRHPRGASKEEGRQGRSSSTYYHVRHPRGASKEEGRQGRSSSTYYHVRHPRGASKEEGRQGRSSSTYYHVRHPRGASKEEGRQGRSSSTYYHVRHPQGASKEEGRQGRSSSTYYHVRHPRGASKEEGCQERSSSKYCQVSHPRGAPIEEDRQERSSSICHQVRHPRGALIEEDRQERSSSIYHQVRHPRGALIEEDRQERSSSICHQVRHPRGALIEEDRQERSSSICHQVRHPRGALIEEDRQERSSIYHQVRHPRGALIEDDRLEDSSSISS
uniref:Reverse transcriptase n=1 Tax=Fagus sylvatica TaxID=28930 RepID=A0A2N9ERL6_FAGSY